MMADEKLLLTAILSDSMIQNFKLTAARPKNNTALANRILLVVVCFVEKSDFAGSVELFAFKDNNNKPE
jgi:hypothetical protein